MSKPVKEMIVRDLESRYAQQDNVVWVELVGVDGLTTNAFRRDLRARQMRLEVVKTSLFKRACQRGPLAPLAAVLEGPVALITGGSAVEIAKFLEQWEGKFPKGSFRVRGAVLDGELLDQHRVRDLSKMPTKIDLQARVLRLVLSPGAQLAAAALSGGRNIAGCLKTMIEKLEKGEELKKSA